MGVGSIPSGGFLYLSERERKNIMRRNQEPFSPYKDFYQLEQVLANLGIAQNISYNNMCDIHAHFLGVYSTYSRPHYHNIEHIAYCLHKLENFHEWSYLASDDFNIPEVNLALRWHDFCYYGENPEIASSLCLINTFSQYCKNESSLYSLLRSAGSILHTTHKDKTARTLEDQITSDIDLLIFAEPNEIYDSYAKKIRLEYSHISDEKFYPNRLKFLESMLSRSQIFDTANHICEDRARKNMNREMELIKKDKIK